MDYSTPLYDALKAYSKKSIIPFHTPGHKLGGAFSDEFNDELFKIDLTELEDTDDLHAPEGVIAQAQKLAAEAFGAEHTFFLVNGSTCGIQAMITGTCNPGDSLIVDRNCHGSVIHALILGNITPHYIYPTFIDDLGLTGGINLESLEKMLQMHPDAKGVLVTSPTYYGIGSDLKRIADIVHNYNKILLVDEAHGAHFRFHPDLPRTALDSGVDICVQSAHKTLPALTQSALLHIKSTKIDIERIKASLKMFQSSSPSFILMAYLDIARNIMQHEGMDLLGYIIKWSEEIRSIISMEDRLYYLGKDLVGRYDIGGFDPTRLVVNFCRAGITGYEVQRELYRDYKVQIEMADLNNIVSILTIGNTREQIYILERAIRKIASKNAKDDNSRILNTGILPSLAMNPREAFYSEGIATMLEDSLGEVCLSLVTVYPPGVPILCPGEIITKEIIEYIYMIRAMGGKITGLEGKDGIQVKKSSVFSIKTV